MSGQPTRAGDEPGSPAHRRALPMAATWRDFGAFLRHPSLPDRAEVSLAGTLRALPSLLLLDLALMAAVFAGIGIATWAGFKLPDHALNDMALTPALAAVIILAAPIGEEIAFRGWLSGRIGHIIGSIVAIPALIALAAAAGLRESQPEVSGVLALVALAVGAVALVIVYILRKRTASGWFQRHFGWFYYASALAFAAMHLTNFAGQGMSATMVPLVLPQLALGLILGYLRVHRGLVAGIALHMLHNALFASLMLAGVR